MQLSIPSPIVVEDNASVAVCAHFFGSLGGSSDTTTVTLMSKDDTAKGTVLYAINYGKNAYFVAIQSGT